MTRVLAISLVVLIAALEIAGQRIRLYGIDAPEAGQTCVAETQWRCGQQAAFALSNIIGSHWVYCAERERDQYGCRRSIRPIISLNRYPP